MVDNSKNTYRTLRIGFVITEDHEIPSWEFEMLKNLLKLEFVYIPVFISKNERLKIKLPFAYSIFRMFENFWFRRVPDAFNRINVKNKFQDVPVICASE